MADSSRSDPRISINKLGEYMTATASRRRRIIQDQKYPKDFIVARYTEAQEPIALFLVGGATDDTILASAISRLTSTTPKSDWDSQRIECCIEALESMLDIEDFDCLKDMTVHHGHSDPQKMVIAGVSISVRPELILRGTDRTGRPTVGAVKLCIGKSKPLDAESASYLTTLVHKYIEDTVAKSDEIALVQRCYVLDVFAKECFCAPRSFTRRRQDIEAACQEIARAWPLA